MTAEWGRDLWVALIESSQENDPQAAVVLSFILESVVIDLVNNQITKDGEFAKVIGARISALIRAGMWSPIQCLT